MSTRHDDELLRALADADPARDGGGLDEARAARDRARILSGDVPRRRGPILAAAAGGLVAVGLGVVVLPGLFSGDPEVRIDFGGPDAPAPAGTGSGAIEALRSPRSGWVALPPALADAAGPSCEPERAGVRAFARGGLTVYLAPANLERVFLGVMRGGSVVATECGIPPQLATGDLRVVVPEGPGAVDTVVGVAPDGFDTAVGGADRAPISNNVYVLPNAGADASIVLSGPGGTREIGTSDGSFRAVPSLPGATAPLPALDAGFPEGTCEPDPQTAVSAKVPAGTVHSAFASGGTTIVALVRPSGVLAECVPTARFAGFGGIYGASRDADGTWVAFGRAAEGHDELAMIEGVRVAVVDGAWAIEGLAARPDFVTLTGPGGSADVMTAGGVSASGPGGPLPSVPPPLAIGELRISALGGPPEAAAARFMARSCATDSGADIIAARTLADRDGRRVLLARDAEGRLFAAAVDGDGETVQCGGIRELRATGAVLVGRRSLDPAKRWAAIVVPDGFRSVRVGTTNLPVVGNVILADDGFPFGDAVLVLGGADVRPLDLRDAPRRLSFGSEPQVSTMVGYRLLRGPRIALSDLPEKVQDRLLNPDDAQLERCWIGGVGQADLPGDRGSVYVGVGLGGVGILHLMPDGGSASTCEDLASLDVGIASSLGVVLAPDRYTRVRFPDGSEAELVSGVAVIPDATRTGARPQEVTFLGAGREARVPIR